MTPGYAVFSSFFGFTVDTYLRQSTVALSPEEYEKMRSFWETTSGIFPVFSGIWFDNGYMFASAHEVLSDKGVDMPVVLLDSLVQTVLGQVVDVPVVVQREVRSADSRASAAVAVHRWSSTSRSWCRGRFPWFSMFGRP